MLSFGTAFRDKIMTELMALISESVSPFGDNIAVTTRELLVDLTTPAAERLSFEISDSICELAIMA
jgi:hypothetical protein